MNKRFKKFKGFPKHCIKCNGDYIASAVNSEKCPTCKTFGWNKKCISCDMDFLTKGDGKYCPGCLKKKTYLRGRPRSEETRKKISEGNRRWSNSPEGKLWHKEHGKENSQKLKKYFKTPTGKAQLREVAKLRSDLMKEKILNGKFTPNITNSFTHWNAEVEYDGKIKKFRSSWEACVWISNPHLQYETIRIPLDSGGCVITDFIDVEDRIIYEIKPSTFWMRQQEKMDTIINYSINNNFKFIWINERNILNYVDKSKFTSDFNKKQLKAMLNGIKTN